VTKGEEVKKVDFFRYVISERPLRHDPKIRFKSSVYTGFINLLQFISYTSGYEIIYYLFISCTVRALLLIEFYKKFLGILNLLKIIFI